MAGDGAAAAGRRQLEDERAGRFGRRARKDRGGRGGLAGQADLMICPPATLLSTLRRRREGLARRDRRPGLPRRADPALSPATFRPKCWPMPGATAVIVGHSERRTIHKETDAQVRAKALAAWRAGLTAIVCIGETRAEREAGQTLDVLGRQLDGSLPDGATGANLVVAYEPVWAIGTGLTPTVADVAQAHGFIRERLAERYGAAGAGHPHPLWRLGEGLERQGTDGGRRCGRRTGRRRQPQGRGVSGHRGRSIAESRAGWKCAGGSCRDRSEFLYEGPRAGHRARLALERNGYADRCHHHPSHDRARHGGPDPAAEIRRRRPRHGRRRRRLSCRAAAPPTC